MRALTKTQFAVDRGVSRARVYQWLVEGRISAIVGGEDDGKIDADEAHRLLDARLDQTKGMRMGGNVTSTSPALVISPFVAGLLQPAASAGAGGYALGELIRTEIMSMAPRLAPVLAVESDPVKIEELLREEILVTLQILARRSAGAV